MRSTTKTVQVMAGTTPYIINQEDLQHAEELRRKYPTVPMSVNEIAVTNRSTFTMWGS